MNIIYDYIQICTRKVATVILVSQIRDGSQFPEMPNDISNLRFVSSNLNSNRVKDYDNNSSNPKLFLKNKGVKNNYRFALKISILIQSYNTNRNNTQENSFINVY